MADPAVRTVNLVKKFGDFVAVDHVSLEVSPGEIFGFLGSNGAGKSTTIRMLCGLLRPNSGEARVNGFDVYREPESIRKTIGYMSQRFSLYDELSVMENVRFFSGVYGVRQDSKHTAGLLKQTGLDVRKDHLTRLLPGGWKQRLALVCAVLHQPPVLFLDEPTSGVDPAARRSFWDLIYRFSDEGRTVFVTTHYMDEAEYCHRLALMHAGRVIALGSPADLKRESRTGELFVLETSDLRKTLGSLEGQADLEDVSVFGGGLHLRVKEGQQVMQRVREQLGREGVQVLLLEPIRPTIEDVFAALIEGEEGRPA